MAVSVVERCFPSATNGASEAGIVARLSHHTVQRRAAVLGAAKHLAQAWQAAVSANQREVELRTPWLELHTPWLELHIP